MNATLRIACLVLVLSASALRAGDCCTTPAKDKKCCKKAQAAASTAAPAAERTKIPSTQDKGKDKKDCCKPSGLPTAPSTGDVDLSTNGK